MPFTPFHMGPGIAVKALLQGSFSLMVFGWSQIVMDIQPLFAMLTGEGQLHGFSHSFAGATLLAVFAALTGKYLSEIGLFILGLDPRREVSIAWWICFLSAFVGTFSHVLLDGIMHGDVEPFYPATDNPFFGLVSMRSLHVFCLYSGLVGGMVYFLVPWIRKRKRSRMRTDR